MTNVMRGKSSYGGIKLGVFFYAVSVISVNCIHIYLSPRQASHRYDALIFPTLQESATKWPPLKLYVYPSSPYHTDDCLYPKNMPNQYTNETHYWFQRMLEPTVHRQFLESPILTNDPEKADIYLFFIPLFTRVQRPRRREEVEADPEVLRRSRQLQEVGM